jgi:uncharacterized protein (TIGR02147 family)
MSVQPSLYDFKGYREYLKAYYDWKKETDGKFTYRSFSELAGLNSPNYLQLVISGRRNLTVDNIHQFSRALGHSTAETQYFEQFVLRDQSDDPRQVVYYNSALKKLKKEKSERTVRVETPELMTNWYFPGVIAVISGRENPVGVDEIVRMSGLKVSAVREILDTLLENKLIVERDGGFLLEEERFVYQYRAKIKDRFKIFQRAQLKRTQEALEKQLDQGAKFFSHAFTIAHKDRDACVERIKMFLSEFSEEANRSKPEELMQLNVQLFGFR